MDIYAGYMVRGRWGILGFLTTTMSTPVNVTVWLGTLAPFSVILNFSSV